MSKCKLNKKSKKLLTFLIPCGMEFSIGEELVRGGLLYRELEGKDKVIYHVIIA